MIRRITALLVALIFAAPIVPQAGRAAPFSPAGHWRLADGLAQPVGYYYKKKNKCDAKCLAGIAAGVVILGTILSNQESKSCPDGQKLSSKGKCYTPEASKTYCPEGKVLSKSGKCVRITKSEPDCPEGKVLSKSGKCITVAKSEPDCPSGQKLSKKGKCYTPEEPQQDRNPPVQTVAAISSIVPRMPALPTEVASAAMAPRAGATRTSVAQSSVVPRLPAVATVAAVPAVGAGASPAPTDVAVVTPAPAVPAAPAIMTLPSVLAPAVQQ